MPNKENVMEFLRNHPKKILLILMLISVSLMVIADNGVFVALAAIFTFPYFIYWLKDNIKAFHQWMQTVKKEFSIFSRYADCFVNMFSKK